LASFELLPFEQMTQEQEQMPFNKMPLEKILFELMTFEQIQKEVERTFIKWTTGQLYTCIDSYFNQLPQNMDT
jgi:hypothetical protein